MRKNYNLRKNDIKNCTCYYFHDITNRRKKIKDIVITKPDKGNGLVILD